MYVTKLAIHRLFPASKKKNKKNDGPSLYLVLSEPREEEEEKEAAQMWTPSGLFVAVENPNTNKYLKDKYL